MLASMQEEGGKSASVNMKGGWKNELASVLE